MLGPRAKTVLSRHELARGEVNHFGKTSHTRSDSYSFSCSCSCSSSVRLGVRVRKTNLRCIRRQMLRLNLTVRARRVAFRSQHVPSQSLKSFPVENLGQSLSFT